MSGDALKNEIQARGGPDKYIDVDEEQYIFKHGEKLGISSANVEAILNQMCQNNGWTRERDILQDLLDLLRETTHDDGAIDQKEFEHCVNYAVSMNMPRKRAMELSVKFVAEHKLKVKKRLFGKDWFDPLRKQYLN